MSNVLELLNDATIPDMGKDYQDVLQRVIPYWDAVAAAFPAGFVDELSDLEAELDEISTQENFARGFRLGARLMLEALGQDT